MALVFTATTAMLLGEEIKKEKIYDQISSIEYVMSDKSINLEDLYIVEIDETKHLCIKEPYKEDEIFNSGQQFMIYKSTGAWIPNLHRDIYIYKDIKTEEYICTDQVLLNVNISSVCDNIVEDIKNNKISVENIDSNYIDSFTSIEKEKTK